MLGIITGLLLVSWLAAPVLAYGAMIVATPFFGELPSDAEKAESTRLVIMAGLAAFAAPALAAITAGRSRALRVIAVTQLVISIAAIVVLVVLLST